MAALFTCFKDKSSRSLKFSSFIAGLDELELGLVPVIERDKR